MSPQAGDSLREGIGSDPVGDVGRPLSELSDTELVNRALEARPGDSRAFDELVRRHQGHIRANCRFIAKDPEAALDLAQEVFVKAYFALSSFRGHSTFRTWLRRIKVNRCLSFNESRWSRPDLRLDDTRPEDHPALRVRSVAQAKVEADETADRITRTLDQIPDTLRIPLVLRDMDGFSYQEIQELLNINLSALKMRIMRGRQAFREVWVELEAEKD